MLIFSWLIKICGSMFHLGILPLYNLKKNTSSTNVWVILSDNFSHELKPISVCETSALYSTAITKSCHPFTPVLELRGDSLWEEHFCFLLLCGKILFMASINQNALALLPFTSKVNISQSHAITELSPLWLLWKMTLPHLLYVTWHDLPTLMRGLITNAKYCVSSLILSGAQIY